MTIDSLPVQLLVAWSGAALGMAGLWLIEQRTRNAGIVDVGWSAGVGLAGIFFAATSTGDSATRRWLVAGLLAVWSFRLAAHLFFDRFLGHPEDGRYQTLRKHWGSRAGAGFFGFFQLQAPLAVAFALPAWVAMRPERGGNLNAFDWAGIAVWALSIGGEALADWQLRRFRADHAHRGQTCRAGLWRYSRHPNYFFEWLHWWAYVLLSVGASWWWGTLAAPALMLFFLLRVTGIPFTEAQALRSRGDDYRRYQQTTSMFIPWFPQDRA